MSKIWVIFLIFFLFIILVQSTSAQSGLYSDLYKYVKSSIVVVQANDSQNRPICQGTGFFINDEGYIVTNFHIISGSSKVNVTTTDGHSYPVKNVLAKDISSDLACLSVDIHSHSVHPIRLNTTPPEVGEEILVIGYPEGPGGLVQSMTRGIVSSVQTLSEYGEVIQVDAAVSPGASGSPLVNMKCEAVGVTTFGYMNGQNQNFAVSCMQVSELIHKISSVQGGKPISEWSLTSKEKSYALGLDLYRMGKYNQSISYFEEAIKLDPNYADAWYKMGNDLFNLGRYFDALQAYNKTIELNPQDSFAWIDKGITLKLLNRDEEALQAYDKAIELNPQNIFPWICKGDHLAAHGQYGEAIQAYDKAIELKPRGLQGSIVWNQKGDSLKAQGKYEEALLAYNKSIELDTHLSNPRTSKGVVLKALGSNPVEETVVTIQPASQQKVTLTLYVHIEDIKGILQGGALVTGYDGNADYFQKNTENMGYVIIEGAPGPWSFIVSAGEGYETSSWSEPITFNCTRHAVLKISLSGVTKITEQLHS